MLSRIFDWFLKRKLIKRYYEDEAEQIMYEFLRENKGYIGIYDKKGKIKRIEKMEVI